MQATPFNKKLLSSFFMAQRWKVSIEAMRDYGSFEKKMTLIMKAIFAILEILEILANLQFWKRSVY